jgi:hypothetical protein
MQGRGTGAAPAGLSAARALRLEVFRHDNRRLS